ncbi:beta-N-acetylglucosaminidase domain-containing protein [Alicyclobacillus fastidiosus]|uniref:Beta-N-acetylglucosaminidase domain-containing protein n=1 Tax=Alicyclobacillus fastidiosus TaxID=392011 RepID=A0ABV5ABB6_9BACL|nr:beta-N-acetylglucosaminidase domain-containing protein [Alicyclobacillus fastidiosus]WEH07715.1 beta-N-acetylglucosaminidase domain-containing protein [Alicyclobacillus fastidiosus]
MGTAASVRGVIEGFYGTYYTSPERDDLIRFAGEQGFNAYFYGPKQDRYHRALWRERYPASTIGQFARTVAQAKEIGVDFWYVISPTSIAYSSDDDFRCLTAKLYGFYELGVRHFGVFLDDIRHEFEHPIDREHFGTYASAHVHLCNRLYAWLGDLQEPCQLAMCPTDYHGVAPFSEYIQELGLGLHEGIQVFYTGPEICSRTISLEDVQAFATVARRKPIVWDNYPVNDLAMRSDLHLGPILGRDARLAESVAGYAANAMNEAEASKIPLLTVADYLRDPADYDPRTALDRALRWMVGETGALHFKRIAENASRSCLADEEAPYLDHLVERALCDIQAGGGGELPAVAELRRYLGDLDEAAHYVKNVCQHYALRRDVLPWIELLEFWSAAGQRALDVIRCVDAGEPYRVPLFRLREATQEIQKHSKRICGQSLLAIVEHANRLVDAAWQPQI